LENHFGFERILALEEQQHSFLLFLDKAVLGCFFGLGFDLFAD
jgi:hypothetical protein